MDTVPMLLLAILASAVDGLDTELDRAQDPGHDLDIVKDRVYRSVDSDMRFLLDSMQSQLKFVTGNLDIVKRMCKVNDPPQKKGNVAFSAVLDKDMISSKASETVVFGRIVSNIGSAYNATNGIFTAPSDGVFVFAWTVLTYPGHWFDSQLVVDGSPKLYNAADSRSGKSWESSGCTGVLQLKAGQRVWISKYSTLGNKLHHPWSSFSGWQIQ